VKFRFSTLSEENIEEEAK